MWLKQVSRPGRLQPGGPWYRRTSWYSCLRFYTLSTAKHCHGSFRTWEGKAQAHGGHSRCAATPASGRSLLGKRWELQKLWGAWGIRQLPLGAGFCWGLLVGAVGTRQGVGTRSFHSQLGDFLGRSEVCSHRSFPYELWLPASGLQPRRAHSAPGA